MLVFPGGKVQTSKHTYVVASHFPPGKESGGYVITTEGAYLADGNFRVVSYLPDLRDVKEENHEAWSIHRRNLIRMLHERSKRASDSLKVSHEKRI